MFAKSINQGNTFSKPANLTSQLEKVNDTQAMQQKHEQDMKAMREEMNQQFSQIMSMIQENPILAQVKPETLTKTLTMSV